MTATQITIIFFVVGVIAVIPVLYYYYRRNPHPRFRPPVGEMAMISVFALMFIGGGSYFMGTVLTSDPDFDAQKPGVSTDRSVDDKPKQESKNDSSDKGLFRGFD